MDAHPVRNTDRLSVLVGLGLAANDENQGTRPALFLEDIDDTKLAGHPIAHVGGTQKLPVAAAIQSVAVEGQWHVEMGVLAGSEVADGWRDVLPSRQRRTEQSFEPAGLSR